MEVHHDAKHPKLPFEPSKCVRSRAGCVSMLRRLALLWRRFCARGSPTHAPPCVPRRCENLHEIHGSTTVGVAVRGSVKKIVH